VNRDGLVRVGLITKARGLKGEMSVMPLTDDPGRFRRLSGVYIERPSGDAIGAVIEEVRYHRGQVVIRLEGCGDADAANGFRGCYVSITTDQLMPLPEDSYYIFDLIGCTVFTEGGAALGELAEVLETGSNDVYVVRPAKSGSGRHGGADADILIPALKTVVLEVDIERKRIVVDHMGIYAE